MRITFFVVVVLSSGRYNAYVSMKESVIGKKKERKEKKKQHKQNTSKDRNVVRLF